MSIERPIPKFRVNNIWSVVGWIMIAQYLSRIHTELNRLGYPPGCLLFNAQTYSGHIFCHILLFCLHFQIDATSNSSIICVCVLAMGCTNISFAYGLLYRLTLYYVYVEHFGKKCLLHPILSTELHKFQKVSCCVRVMK